MCLGAAAEHGAHVVCVGSYAIGSRMHSSDLGTRVTLTRRARSPQSDQYFMMGMVCDLILPHDGGRGVATLSAVGLAFGGPGADFAVGGLGLGDVGMATCTDVSHLPRIRGPGLLS